VDHHKQALLAQGRATQLLTQLLLLLLVLLVLLLCCRDGCVLHVHCCVPHHATTTLATPLSCKAHERPQLSKVHVADAAADDSPHAV
jgi:hypothetical protein